MEVQNEYGTIIAYERAQTDIPLHQLCEGLCSESQLQRIELGTRACEKILADALLQRLGVCADQFSYIINPQEQEIILLREEIVEQVDNNQTDLATKSIEQYKALTTKNSKLHTQFCLLAESVMEWKNNGDKEQILIKLQEAWQISRTQDICRLEGQYLSFAELALSMLYIRIHEELGDKNTAITGYQNILSYLNTHIDERDRVKWYPQIAYHLILLHQNNGDITNAITICEESFSLLKKQASLLYLQEILTIYYDLKLEYYQQSHLSPSTQETEELNHMIMLRDSLDWLYHTYHIRKKHWIWNVSFGLSELYLCQDMIRSRRIGLNMTQEELADGICDPVTISRIECGKSYPQRAVLEKLLQKLGLPGTGSSLTAQVGKPEYHRLADELNVLLHLSKHKESKLLLEELDQKIKHKSIHTQQFLTSNLYTVKYVLKEISAQEHYSLMEQALHLTVPDADYSQLEKWCFTRAEARCINMMSLSCEKVGTAKHVIRLLEALKKSYETQPLGLRYFHIGYTLTTRSLGNLLGNIMEYEQAIGISTQGLILSLGLMQSLTLESLTYDIGWDMEQLFSKSIYTPKESLPYINASYSLALFQEQEYLAQFFNEHLDKVYNTTI